MTTPLITIPLQEYNELVRINSELKSVFDNKKTVLYLRQFYSGPSGYPANEYSIANESELVEKLNKELKEAREINNEYYNSNYKLQDVIRNKRWWHYVPQKTWYQLIPFKGNYHNK